MVNKYMKICPNLLVTKEMQIKITMNITTCFQKDYN